MITLLIDCVYNRLIEYGHSEEEIDLLLSGLDDMETELRCGSCLSFYTHKWLDRHGYRVMDEYTFDEIDEGVVRGWGVYLYLNLLSDDLETCHQWAVASIKHVLSPNYWQKAKITLCLEHELLSNSVMHQVWPKGGIQNLVKEAMLEHYCDDHALLIDALDAYLDSL